MTLLICASLAIGACQSKHVGVRLSAPVSLMVGEGFVNPLGYYEAQPRFSWQVSVDSEARRQSAYQIQVATSKQLLSSNVDLWDSARVESSQTSWLRYQGKPLVSRQKLYWRVRIWDEQERISAWSEAQSIELGLLSSGDWRAQWIGHADTSTEMRPSKSLLATPQYLRREFITDGDVQRARLYITAKGLFKPYINGEPIAGDDVMTPGWTPYAKRIESLTYDVTESIKQGDNVIAATIAGGWYAGRIAGLMETDHRLPARLLAQLEITYMDGRVQKLVTDGSWLASQQGPIRFASIYDGERYEQAKEMSQAHIWVPVEVEPLQKNVAIAPKRHAPVRTIESLQVAEIVKREDGVAVFDFGQNMVGVPRLKLPAVAGQEVKVRFAEALHKGAFYTENYRSAESTNRYLPSETGVIEYQPTFTYHGYRYVEVSGFDQRQEPKKDWVTALVQHSDIKLHSNFNSGHRKLNQLSRNIVWGMRSNFFDIPLDCPQRDERLGWTGDAQAFLTPSMYMADVYAFWSAWLQSVREEQADSGMVPLYIPFIKWINWASSGWGDAATIIPWQLYVLTGDKSILEDNYQMMKGWLEYHKAQSRYGISTMKTFGDWLQPFPQIEGKAANRGDTDFSLISTAFYIHSVQLTLNSARVLAKTDDVAVFSRQLSTLKKAFRKAFFDEDLNLKKGTATQTSYLLGLAFSLFDSSEKDLAQQKLIGLIEKADKHLRTGFLGTPLLASVLQEANRSDLVYELLFKETYPSWFYSINNGATTTWERWNSYSLEEGFNPQGMNSLNHYAYGTIARWFYEGILGIQPAKAGFSHIRIAPQLPPQKYRLLDHASGFYDTPEGRVAVAWKINSTEFTLEVMVPKNSTADILMPSVDTNTLRLNGALVMASDVGALKMLPPGRYLLQARLLQ